MLWEVDIYPAEGQPDLMGRQVRASAADLGLGANLEVAAARGYLIQGQLDRSQVERIARELLADAVVERTAIAPVGNEILSWAFLTLEVVAKVNRDLRHPRFREPSLRRLVHVLPKPGVMDPVAQSAMGAIADLGISVEAVRTLKKYWIGGVATERLDYFCNKVLANDAIEQVVLDQLTFEKLEVGSPYAFRLVTVPVRTMDDAALERLSREGQLFLSLVEMQTIRGHFQALGRDPTDVELETLAQTWSEHCSHKTLAGRIRYRDPSGERHFENMLKETIFAATQQIRREAGPDDWCVSVFSDNAGVIRFDDQYNVVFKVETHNHPSALEPYGGANTGIGGVIRDPMGTGMGAKPVCNTDVFCFAPPDTPVESLPPGVLHPRRVMQGVVAGVRDYGNRMGIPTVNGAIYFDPRYLGNPLVYCGNVGLIPRDKSFKHPQAGDLIVAVGGRTGRDGIHGATFSSAELTSHSETVSGGAVQIGNAITEKMLLDVLLVARDRGLYNAVTDCGAGGFSSAVGEMGEKIGAEVWLDRVPLKYEGLSYTEIWISEAQERMTFSVPPEKWDELSALCASEGVEATVIGRFEPTGRLVLKYHDQQVADLAMAFLHDGRPPVVRDAVFVPPPARPLTVERAGPDGLGRLLYGLSVTQLRHLQDTLPPSAKLGDLPKRLRHLQETTKMAEGMDVQVRVEMPVDFTDTLLQILGSLNVCSKEWVIRQYDHEVQGGSVIKPLVGAVNDGPSDAAVLRPVLGSRRGIVIACGMNPRYGDLDPYWMAAGAIDEAVRNCVAVGADPRRIAILDNFCWGATDRPETLGSLVRAALACYDVATVLGTPFISGKDSLNNEFRPLGGKGDCPSPRSVQGTVPFSAEAEAEKGTVPICAQHPEGRSGKWGLSPFTPPAEPISIPPSLLISALGQVDDVRRCVTMDLKEPGNYLYLVGLTRNELGGSHYALLSGLSGGDVPTVDAATAKRTFGALHQAISAGLVRACHDLSEGGLAVAAAEMAFAGGLGARISLADAPVLPSPCARGTAPVLPSPAGRGAGGEGSSEGGTADDSATATRAAILLFSESNTRFLCEVQPANAATFDAALADVPHARVGEVTDAGKLEFVYANDPILSADVAALKEAWQKPLRW